ncbi:hypothetical protein G7066_00890 [Leucobacter coleopterorum]|uniref:Uncharacterized protein n=1 Tax=Leucobacter coleopterorum TaxID=2714933 RepID=A0ABX6JXQ4_9MICO|nr:hypothetical protein [Leucobacter coleopterorum]QIM17624.1 hypothetical protein G7066_00890 [Leucobacter coleopterorum]
MSRREKTSIGWSPLMIIAVLVAIALAISFPFALVSTMPKQVSPLEQVKQALEDAAPGYDGDALNLNSLRVLETAPDGTIFLAGHMNGGGIAGVIFRDGGTYAGTVTSQDRDDVGFAGSDAGHAAYLYIKAEPQNKLGFHYCARSIMSKKPTDKLRKELAVSCGAALD